MHRCLFTALTLLVCLDFAGLAAGQSSNPAASIRSALTFYASFDHGSDADLARGDRRIYTASSAERKDPRPGLPPGEIEVAQGQGRRGGGALRFLKRTGKDVFYKVEGNLNYRAQDWSSTVSFWLGLDPQTDLGDWYCDPIQITEKSWDDAAIWVDFSKDERPKLFRLGVLADRNVWNPAKRDFEKMAATERPVHVVTNPPFARGRWTHVTITCENFNTGKSNGTARLYLNGKLEGSVSGRNQMYHWNAKRAAVQLGMGYVGLYDDLALFDRALSESEVQALFRLEGCLVETK